MLAKTLLVMLRDDTQYNEERYDLRNFFISDTNNQACVWFKYTLPRCR
jgi:hypothetical protein